MPNDEGNPAQPVVQELLDELESLSTSEIFKMLAPALEGYKVEQVDIERIKAAAKVSLEGGIASLQEALITAAAERLHIKEGLENTLPVVDSSTGVVQTVAHNSEEARLAARKFSEEAEPMDNPM